jgi:HD superfamily phosphohydrolase
MKKYSFLVFCSFCFFGTAYGQTRLMYEQEALKRLSEKIWHQSKDNLASPYETDFEKNALIFENWAYGSLYFTDQTHIDSVLLNFDSKVESVVVKMMTDFKPVIIDANLLSYFEIYGEEKNRKFIKKGQNEFEKRAQQSTFLEAIWNSNDNESSKKVYKELTKVFSSAKNQVSYGSLVAEDRYELKSSYFYSDASGLITEFFLTRKSVIDALGENKAKEAIAYMKRNKYKWSLESDIIKLFEELG